MTYEKSQKKKSDFTNDDLITNASTLDYVKEGVNKKTSWSNLLDKIGDVYGASLRMFDTESELVASDIRIGEHAIVVENGYTLYSIGNLAASTGDVTLTSGYVATFRDRHQTEYDDYTELRGLKSSAIPDGMVIKITNDGIAGDFVAKTGANTDNGGTIIQAGDGVNRYYERVFSGALNVLWFGAARDGSTNDAEAFNAAIVIAASQTSDGAVYAPQGQYAFTSNINVVRGVHLIGDGYGTELIGTGSSLVITNTLPAYGTNVYAGLKNLRVRVTDAGTAVRCDGDNVNGAVTRWVLENVYIVRTDGKSGKGLSVSAAWNCSIVNTYVAGWDVGFEIDLDGPDYSWGMNGSVWTGGQIEGNNTAVSINGGISFAFNGVVIETNSTMGVDIDQARNISFNGGCYFEGNGEDFRIGNTSACYNVTIQDSYFNTTSPFNAYAINAVNCIGLDVRKCRFERYTAEPILIAGSGVTGEASNNTKDSATTIGMVDVATNSADRFKYSDADHNLKDTTLTIASAAITITSDFHRIDTEGAAASDQLQTINGGVRGMLLTIAAASSARTVTVQSGGNIATTGAGNMDLDNSSDVIHLIYSEVSGLWLALPLGNNGT